MNFMDLLFYDRVTTVELYVFTIQVTDKNVRKSMISSNAERLQKKKRTGCIPQSKTYSLIVESEIEEIDGRSHCMCSNHLIPYFATDLAYHRLYEATNHFLTSTRASKEHISK